MRNAKPTTGVLVVCAMLLGANSVRADDWPQWRGPHRNNKVAGFTEPKTWPKELTKKWAVNVGLGDASPSLVGDRLYVFARQGGDEVVLCLSAKDGSEVWKDKYAVTAPRIPGGGHTGPRGTPAVADGKVCTLGVSGVLSCYDAKEGKLLWRKETKGTPGFSAAASPMILDGLCIAQIGGGGRGGKPGGGGGPGEVVAYDLAKGDEKWKWSATDGTAYGSCVPMTVDKAKMIVIPTAASIVGINAADGKELWKFSFKTTYNSATPIIDGQTVIYSGPRPMREDGGGTVAYKIEKKDDGFTAKDLWKKDASSAAGIYNTPVLKDGLLFGLMGGNRAPAYLFCMNAETGEVLWKDDKTKRGECGEILDAGSVLIALTSDSELLFFKPSKKGYEELAKYKVSDKTGNDGTWAYPVIAGNRVFVKDKDSLILWTIE
jgi:outer membrane protein assembly factor BamB